MRYLFPLIALSFCLPPHVVEAESPKKYALLAAVTKYEHAGMNAPQLEYPEVDAKELGELLTSFGYEVDLLLGKQATQEAIRKKLESLNTKGEADGVALIGLFGHGVLVDAGSGSDPEGCFCPYDVPVRFVKDRGGTILNDDNGKPMTEPDSAKLIKISEILLSLKIAKAGNRVVLADCCRNQPNQARGRNLGIGASFKVSDIPENTAVLFGCSPNQKAFEHKEWGHGAFTKCLLDELAEMTRLGEDATTGVLADRLKKKVPKLVATMGVSDRQVPRPFSNDSIDLQLVPPIKSTRIDKDESRRRISLANKMLSAIEHDLDNHGIQNASSVRVMLAWNFAQLGNSAKSSGHMSAVIGDINKSGGNSLEAIEAIARTIAVAAKRDPQADFAPLVRQLKKAAQINGGNRGDAFAKIADSLVLGNDFRSKFDPDEVLDDIEIGSAYEAIVRIANEPRCITGDYKTSRLPRLLDAISRRRATAEEDTFSKSDLAILAAINNDIATVKKILMDQYVHQSHESFCVVPFALRGQNEEVEQICSLPFTKSEPHFTDGIETRAVLAANVFLDLGDEKSARKLSRHLIGRQDMAIVCRGERAFPWPATNSGVSHSIAGHGTHEKSRLAGRLFLEKKLAEVKEAERKYLARIKVDSGIAPAPIPEGVAVSTAPTIADLGIIADLAFIDGLVADIPVVFIFENKLKP